MLIPSRGPHPCFRSGVGPAGTRAGTESQPACRRGRGSRRLDGSAVGESGKTGPWPACRTRIGSPRSPPVRRRRPGPGSVKASAGGDAVPEHSRLCRRCEGEPGQQPSSTPRGNLRRRPDDGEGGGGGAGRRRWASSPPQPEGLLVLIPPGDLQNSDRPPACRWEIGAGQARRSTPRGDSRRRPGDGEGGVGVPVRSRWASPFPPQSRGPF